MNFANEHDIATYVATFVESDRSLDEQRLPNLARAAVNLERLMYWTNSVSDGWCYWPKPCRSASKLIDLLESRRYSHDDDITLTELRKALSPIKSMLTRARGAGIDTNYDGYHTPLLDA